MGNCCCQPDETFEIKRPLKEKVKKWKLNVELIAQTQLWTEFTKDQFDSYGSQSFQILPVTMQLLEQLPLQVEANRLECERSRDMAAEKRK